MKRKKVIRLSFVLGSALLLTLLLVFFEPYLKEYTGKIDSEKFIEIKSFLDSFGIFKHLAVLVIQFLQVFIFFLPGELVELLAGYVSGTVFGTVICIAGVWSAAIVQYKVALLLGKNYIDRIQRSKIYKKATFLHNGETGDFILFLLFLLPGLPKDALNLLAPIMKTPFKRFLWITIIARFPSIISSTYVGAHLAKGEFFSAAYIYVITGIVSLVGVAVYDVVMMNLSEKQRKI